jgi:hypothetical protein
MKPTFTDPPMKLTGTDAYFNYLKHQSEQQHNETVAQRTQGYDRLSLAARRSMTPEKIKRLRLQKREKKENHKSPETSKAGRGEKRGRRATPKEINRNGMCQKTSTNPLEEAF